MKNLLLFLFLAASTSIFAQFSVGHRTITFNDPTRTGGFGSGGGAGRQIQTEIQKVLDSVPETILQDVLDFLKALQDQPEYKVRMANNLRQILSEDKELLEKLAQ